MRARNAVNEAIRIGVCETLLPDVVPPEAHQNDRSYVPELSGLLLFWFTTQEFNMVGSYTENPQKHVSQHLQNHITVKIGRWMLAQDNTVTPFQCPSQI